ncbi:tetratricopeptide repeat protein [Aporhodopirellula aestuarii]|uniref:Tetratricopeptide repeat protein n=1 Tax=Aporhodopirellula aestuarii TaxID=2950107 RepID=A0ABT0U747_9BACT|nr:hypothetical protein [Aporhodopirellula aestuarii]MCM2372755.1 hypothetical protein [Aporhodopirellula aestuarii]
MRAENIRASAQLVGAASRMPGAFDDFDTAIEITTQSWKDAEQFHESQNLLFVLNRAERFEELFTTCDAMAGIADERRDKSILLHLKATALYHLDRMEEANALLSQATKFFSESTPGIGPGREIPGANCDWFVMSVSARNEANEVALTKLDDVMTTHPDDIELLATRAQLHFLWRRWEAATRDFQQLAQRKPHDLETLELAAISALLAGQIEDFQALSEGLEQMLNKLENAESAWEIAQCLTLIPGNIRDEERVLAAVQENAKQRRFWWRHQAVIGVLYRIGRYEEAAALVEPTLAIARGQSQRQRSVTLLWQSMLQWQLGDQATARKTLVNATSLIDQNSQPAGVYVHGNADTELIVLRREAEELIGNADVN